jgi:hypothetical protein
MTLSSIALLLCLTAAAAPPPDGEFSYAGISRKTTQAQLLARYPHARHNWVPYDKSIEFYYDAEPGDDTRAPTPRAPSIVTVTAVGEDGSSAPFGDTSRDRQIISGLARTNYGHYSVDNKDKDSRGVDGVDALMRKGRIEELSMSVRETCAAVVKQLTAAYGKPDASHHFEGEEGSGQYMEWTSPVSRLHLSCGDAPDMPGAVTKLGITAPQ